MVAHPRDLDVDPLELRAQRVTLGARGPGEESGGGAAREEIEILESRHLLRPTSDVPSGPAEHPFGRSGSIALPVPSAWVADLLRTSAQESGAA